ncbi:MAG: (2Fe-2S) ferredoxin domain-containing protein [Firmicutes bacterium]|nr:(2Fe-2S) ferredoxin domain-containing protein [Bacillota bacterium]
MLTINVCIGSACHLKGSYKVINRLKELIENKNLENKVTLKAAFCLGDCTKAVAVKINDENVLSVSPENVDEFFNKSIMGRLYE